MRRLFHALRHHTWQLRSWIQSGSRYFLERWSRRYETKIVARLPSLLVDHVLYIVEEDGYREQAAMLCPCGCGKTLHMNLLPDERPCWRIIEHNDGTTSLRPSVWRKKDCRSHFWFSQGRIIWVDDRLGSDISR